MKIAVPTNDGTSISAHFGRSAAFLVFDVENGKVADRALRPNNGCPSHEPGACQSESGEGQPHSHAAILAAIADCQVVLCGGMGPGAVDALRAHGISPVFIKETGLAEPLVEAYAAGSLKPQASSSCHCHH